MDAVTHDEAAASCNAKGMKLTLPLTLADLDSIRAQFSQEVGQREIYTGFTKYSLPPESELWQVPTEHSITDEGSCISLNRQGSWRVNHIECSSQRGYICEKGEIHIFRYSR